MPTPGSRAPLILFACVVLSACSGKPDVPAAPTVLLRGLGPEPDSLDPQRATSAEAVTVLRDLCEGLTTLDKHAAAAPGAAATFAISPRWKNLHFPPAPRRPLVDRRKSSRR